MGSDKNQGWGDDEINHQKRVVSVGLGGVGIFRGDVGGVMVWEDFSNGSGGEDFRGRVAGVFERQAVVETAVVLADKKRNQRGGIKGVFDYNDGDFCVATENVNIIFNFQSPIFNEFSNNNDQIFKTFNH